ncbi:MAG TPA: ester cyclase [Chitinophaga sp.]|uniref:ester cyclase n=1 Tax=Chitinophaga sp. TaxID=1869181 RepID=UPI002BBD84B8|nr:ester cyclase [Chitinophaga sp.]HVI46387.1 ester cyclase [Chitinophaga sp.]
MQQPVILPALALLILTAMLPACSKQPPPAAVQNKKIVQRYFNEVWNQGHLNVLDELLSAGYINHTPSTPNPPIGPGGLKPIVTAFHKGVPDLHYEIMDIIANDSMAVARVVVTGTQQDSLFGLPPTGKKFTVNQINIEKIVNGKIAEHWRVTDDLTMMRQLGHIQ